MKISTKCQGGISVEIPLHFLRSVFVGELFYDVVLCDSDILRKLAYSNILKISPPKIETLVFLFLLKT